MSGTDPTERVKCSRCQGGLGRQSMAASMSGSVMGDEYTETYFLCETCGVYTLEIWHERFCGEDSISVSGPIAKGDGDEKVALIRRCPEPWDKRCRCEAHLAYFGGSLD